MNENRETFFARLEPFYPPSVLCDIGLAYTLAKYGHRAQVRKETDEEGRPVRYFEHVRRVAIVLIDEAKVIDPSMTIAALLHDGIEDTRDLTPAMIEHTFGSDVAQIVKILSKTPKQGYLDRFMLVDDWRPFVIKACDRIDNLRTLTCASYEFRTKQVSETKEKYYPLFDTMVELTPERFKQRVSILRDTVHKETEIQATLLRP